jgi:hypothetical protein
MPIQWLQAIEIFHHLTSGGEFPFDSWHSPVRANARLGLRRLVKEKEREIYPLFSKVAFPKL